MKDIFFVGGARDYHAMDWYRTVRAIADTRKIVFVTDLIESEGFDRLITEDDEIIELFNIDRLLFRTQSKYGDMWRNLVKLVFLPIQVWRLRAIARKNPDALFHAHTMYYMLLCYVAGIDYIGTPQGSEILVRPKSRMYRFLIIRSLRGARHITVDSVNMQKRIRELCGKGSTVIQNGIDASAIEQVVKNAGCRENIVSIRGFTPLYRIHEIVDARARSSQKPAIRFLYPFVEEMYKTEIMKRFQADDQDMGRLLRIQMYELLASAKLVISIPASDSSPRSVYEAIFCGACVAVTYNPWIDALPECMRARLFLVNVDDPLWFDKALTHSQMISRIPYIPSGEALDMFDQRRTMQSAIVLLY